MDLWNIKLQSYIILIWFFVLKKVIFARVRDENFVPKYTKHYIIPIKDKYEQILQEDLNLNGVDRMSGLAIGKKTSYFVSPEAEDKFQKVFRSFKLNPEKLSNNVMELFDKQKTNKERQLRKNISNGGKFNFGHYFTYEEISSYMDYLKKNFKDFVDVKNIGKTYENRTIFGVVISQKSIKKTRPVLFFDAGIHAREWFASTFALHLLNQFIENKSVRDKYLPHIDLAIIPLANPDGYTFSRTKDPFWRKNRRPHPNCLGTDLNRNFNIQWAKTECDYQLFAGSKAFSESETQAIKSFAQSFPKNSIRLYVALHSFGQYLLHSWGFTNKRPDDVASLLKCGNFVNKYLRNVYKVGAAAEILPPTVGGCSDDYFKHELGVKYSFTMELTDGYDFHPNVSVLQKEITKAMPGIFGFADFIKANYPTNKIAKTRKKCGNRN